MTLKDARVALGWTQQQLAKESGVGQQTISQLELGGIKDVSHGAVVRLLRALHHAGLVGLTAEMLFPIAETTPANSTQGAA